MEKLKKLKAVIKKEIKWIKGRPDNFYKEGSIDMANFILTYIQLLEKEVEEVQG